MLALYRLSINKDSLGQKSNNRFTYRLFYPVLITLSAQLLEACGEGSGVVFSLNNPGSPHKPPDGPQFDYSTGVLQQNLLSENAPSQGSEQISQSGRTAYLIGQVTGLTSNPHKLQYSPLPYEASFELIEKVNAAEQNSQTWYELYLVLGQNQKKIDYESTSEKQSFALELIGTQANLNINFEVKNEVIEFTERDDTPLKKTYSVKENSTDTIVDFDVNHDRLLGVTLTIEGQEGSTADGDKFEIEGTSIRPREQLDYENPNDHDLDRQYNIKLIATSVDGTVVEQLINIQLENQNDVPTNTGRLPNKIILRNGEQDSIGIDVLLLSFSDQDNDIKQIYFEQGLQDGLSISYDGLNTSFSGAQPFVIDIDDIQPDQNNIRNLTLLAEQNTAVGQYRVPYNVFDDGTPKLSAQASSYITIEVIDVNADFKPQFRVTDNNVIPQDIVPVNPEAKEYIIEIEEGDYSGNRAIIIANIAATDISGFDRFASVILAGTRDEQLQFVVSLSQIRFIGIADFEGDHSYTITITATETDDRPLSNTISFTVNITDQNEAPTDIILSQTQVYENIQTYMNYQGQRVYPIAQLTIIDPDNNSQHADYSSNNEAELLTDYEDNSSFIILGNMLYVKEQPNYESKQEYNIRILATDKMNPALDAFVKDFTIEILDRNDAPQLVSNGEVRLSDNLVRGESISVSIGRLLSVFIDADGVNDIKKIFFTEIPVDLQLFYQNNGQDTQIQSATDITATDITATDITITDIDGIGISQKFITIRSSLPSPLGQRQISYNIRDSGDIAVEGQQAVVIFQIGEDSPPDIDMLSNDKDIIITPFIDAAGVKTYELDFYEEIRQNVTEQFVASFEASDPEGSPLLLSVEIADNQGYGGEIINVRKIAEQHYELYFENALDFESLQGGSGVYNLRLTLREDDENPQTQVIDIIARLRDENEPVSRIDLRNTRISENLQSEQITVDNSRVEAYIIGEFAYIDPDTASAHNDNQVSIIGRDSDYFGIIDDSRLYLNQQPDFELKHSYEITILVRDRHNPTIVATKSLSIIVEDEDEVPEITSEAPVSTITVSENISNIRELVLHRFVAEDYDITPVEVGYRVAAPYSAYFSISTTAGANGEYIGELKFHPDAILDYESPFGFAFEPLITPEQRMQRNFYQFEVYAFSTGSSGFTLESAPQTVSIQVENVDERPEREQAQLDIETLSRRDERQISIESLLSLFSDGDGSDDIKEIVFTEALPLDISLFYKTGQNDPRVVILLPNQRVVINDILGSNVDEKFIILQAQTNAALQPYSIAYNVVDTAELSASEDAVISFSISLNHQPLFTLTRSSSSEIIDPINPLSYTIYLVEGDYSEHPYPLAVVSASDPDVSTMPVLLEVKSNSNGDKLSFTLNSDNSESGTLAFTGTANFEDIDEYNIEFEATEQDASALSQTITVSIVIQDVNEQPSDITLSQDEQTQSYVRLDGKNIVVSEDIEAREVTTTIAGQVVTRQLYLLGTLEVDDPDGATSSFTSSSFTPENNISSFFTIIDNRLYLQQLPDYETAQNPPQPDGTISIGSITTTSVDGENILYSVNWNVFVSNVDEPPIISSPPLSDAVPFSENADRANALHVFRAYDPEGDAVHFEFADDAYYSNIFTIETTLDITTRVYEGALRFRSDYQPDFGNPNDKNADGLYEIEIIAYSVDVNGRRNIVDASQQLQIQLVDSDYEPQRQSASISIPYLFAGQQSIVDVSEFFAAFSDQDDDLTSLVFTHVNGVTISYSAGDDSTPPDQTVTFSSHTPGTYNIEFNVRDAAGLSASDTATTTLEVLDIAVALPPTVVVSDSYQQPVSPVAGVFAISIDEGQTNVGVVIGIDPNIAEGQRTLDDVNIEVTQVVGDSNPAIFEFDADTDSLVFITEPDYEMPNNQEALELDLRNLYAVQLTATKATDSNSAFVFTFTINVQVRDVNEPVTDIIMHDSTISEGDDGEGVTNVIFDGRSEQVYRVGVARVNDDGSANNRGNVSIGNDPDTNAAFTDNSLRVAQEYADLFVIIQSQEGYDLYMRRKPDYEIARSHIVVLEAYDSNDDSLVFQKSFEIQVIDEVNEPIVFLSLPPDIIEFSEASSIINVVYHAYAVDYGNSAVKYELSSDLPASQYFEIEEATGKLRFRYQPDYERPFGVQNAGSLTLGGLAEANVYEVVINAISRTDASKLSGQRVLISITNTDDTAIDVILSSNMIAQNALPDENHQTYYFIADINVVDGDYTYFNPELETNSLSVEGYDADKFAIIDNNKLYLKQAPGEGIERDRYFVTIKSVSRVDETSIFKKNFEIFIEDTNDPPRVLGLGAVQLGYINKTETLTVTSEKMASAFIDEDTNPAYNQINSFIFAEIPDFVTISHQLADASWAPVEAGAVITGDITITMSESAQVSNTDHRISYYAVDNAMGVSAAAVFMKFKVADTTDLPPYFVDQHGDIIFSRSFTIPENSQADFELGRIMALDPEYADNIRYTITGGSDISSGAFRLDLNTDELWFRIAADYEMPLDADLDNIYEVTISATASQNSYSSMLVRVYITDVNEVLSDLVLSTDFTSQGKVVFIAEEIILNALGLYRVGYLEIDDPDTRQDFRGHILTVSGDDGSDFLIQNDILYLKEAPNFSVKPSYSITIEAADDEDETLTRSFDFEIRVSDENQLPVRIRIVKELGDIMPSESVDLTIDEFLNGFYYHNDVRREGVTKLIFDDITPSFTLSHNYFDDEAIERQKIIAPQPGQQNAEVLLSDISDGLITFSLLANEQYEQNFFRYKVVGNRGFVSAEYSVITFTVDNDATDLYPVFRTEQGGNIIEQAFFVETAENLPAQGVFATLYAEDSEGIDTIAYFLQGGPDAAMFTVDRATGQLSSNTIFDYENPVDANNDGVYEFNVRAAELDATNLQNLSSIIQVRLTVTNSNDVPDGMSLRPQYVNLAGESVITIHQLADRVLTENAESVNYYLVGTLFALDEDEVGTVFQQRNSFRIVPPESPAENHFAIFGDQLYIKNISQDSTYSANIALDDDGSEVLQRSFSVHVVPISLSYNSAWSEVPGATMVPGEIRVAEDFLPDEPSRYLVATIVGSKDVFIEQTDSDYFEIIEKYDKTELYLNIDSFDYETTSRYSAVIYVRSPNLEVYSILETFFVVISVTDVELEWNVRYNFENILFEEDSTEVIKSFSALHDDGNDVLYSLQNPSEGDASYFTIDSQNGALRFTNPPDYENPLDNDIDNIYEITIIARSGSDSTSQHIRVEVVDINDEMPSIFLSSHSIVENAIPIDFVGSSQLHYFVGTLSTDSIEAGIFLPLSGTDAAKFTIVKDGLYLLEKPDYEVTGSDLYSVTAVRSRRDYNIVAAVQNFSISVVDLDEEVVFAPATEHVFLAENTAVASVLHVFSASDPDDGDIVTFSLQNPALGDARYFAIDAHSGELTITQELDFESPVDADTDNYYEITAIATSSAAGQPRSVKRNFYVTVRNIPEDDVDDAPIFIGDDAQPLISATENVQLPENSDSYSYRLNLLFDNVGNNIRYSIVGGVDAEFFSFSASESDVVIFRNPPADGETPPISFPNYEMPLDANADNIYEVTIQVQERQTGFEEQALSSQQSFLFEVTDINEPPELIRYTFNLPEVTRASETVVAIEDLLAAFQDPDASGLQSIRFTSIADNTSLYYLDNNDNKIEITIDGEINLNDIDEVILYVAPAASIGGERVIAYQVKDVGADDFFNSPAEVRFDIADSIGFRPKASVDGSIIISTLNLSGLENLGGYVMPYTIDLEGATYEYESSIIDRPDGYKELVIASSHLDDDGSRISRIDYYVNEMTAGHRELVRQSGPQGFDDSLTVAEKLLEPANNPFATFEYVNGRALLDDIASAVAVEPEIVSIAIQDLDQISYDHQGYLYALVFGSKGASQDNLYAMGLTTHLSNQDTLTSRHFRLIQSPRTDSDFYSEAVDFITVLDHRDLYSGPQGYYTPTFVDLNGDNKKDYVLGMPDGTFVYLTVTSLADHSVYRRPWASTMVLQSGENSPFHGIDLYPVDPSPDNLEYYRANSPSFFDVDNDQDYDLIVGTIDGIRYFENTGNRQVPQFTERTGTDNPLHSDNYGRGNTIAFIDVDGDGDEDLLLGDIEGGGLSFIENLWVDGA